MPRIVALATEHRLPEAFSDLMDGTEKTEEEEMALIEKGRLALMIWTYERLCVSPLFVYEDPTDPAVLVRSYTTSRGKPALSRIPSAVRRPPFSAACTLTSQACR